MFRLLIIVLIGAAIYYHLNVSPLITPSDITQPSGILVATAPLQQNVNIVPWSRNGYEFTALAGFALQARVLGKTSYHMDRESDLSNVDLALGWQEMSDTRIISQLDITQSNRWYYYRWPNMPPLPPEVIVNKSGNMHIIAGTKEVKQALAKVAKGNVISLEGYLVQVKGKDGWQWISSTSRSDTGNRSCEVIWVTRLSILR